MEIHYFPYIPVCCDCIILTYQFSSVATQAVVEVGEGTQGTADLWAKGNVGICSSFQQLLHCLCGKSNSSLWCRQTLVFFGVK